MTSAQAPHSHATDDDLVTSIPCDPCGEVTAAVRGPLDDPPRTALAAQGWWLAGALDEARDAAVVGAARA
ncbi:MAG: hypothetical protein LBS56_10370 [Propionibacteriaceae bacterium]|jgi:hypothetical protein|nr:hypothetical protein [Propionibacteriaceae bacterium]